MVGSGCVGGGGGGGRKRSLMISMSNFSREKLHWWNRGRGWGFAHLEVSSLTFEIHDWNASVIARARGEAIQGPGGGVQSADDASIALQLNAWRDFHHCHLVCSSS